MTEEHEDKGREPVVYELGYHLVPSLSEEDLALRVGELRKMIEEKGAPVFAEGDPELISLAYEITKHVAGSNQRFSDAHFGWMKFEVMPEELSGITDALDLDQAVIRHLLVKSDRDQAVPFTRLSASVSEKVIEHKPDTAGDTGEVSEEEFEKAVEELVGEDPKDTKKALVDKGDTPVEEVAKDDTLEKEVASAVS